MSATAKTYRIETERLVIRSYQPKDAQMLLDATTISLQHLLPWMPWAREEPTSLDAKIELLRRMRGQFDLDMDYVFGVFNKDETEVLGSSGLHTRIGGNAREIGYWISADHVRKGYATEVVGALTKVAFYIEDIDRVEIHCASANIASKGVPEKLGFTFEATLKHRNIDAFGAPRDTMIWTMFRDDYEKSPIREMPLRAFDVVGREILV